MKRIVVAFLVVFVVVLAACGSSDRAAPGETTPAGPSTTEAGGEQLRAALQAWAQFPVRTSPRPLVLTAPPVSDPAHGFRTGDDKIAYISGAFTAPAALPSGPQDAAGFSVVSAAQALAVLRAEGNPDNGKGSSPPAPLVITAVRFGSSRFFTDRGPRVLPAWLFSFAGVQDPAAVLAVDPSARFPASAVPFLPSMGARIAPDGRTVTVTFTGAAAGSGPCTADYSVDQLASATAVAVSVRETRNGGGTCAAIGYDRHADVVLDSPLGARVLVDATTKAAIAVDH